MPSPIRTVPSKSLSELRKLCQPKALARQQKQPMEKGHAASSSCSDWNPGCAWRHVDDLHVR